MANAIRRSLKYAVETSWGVYTTPALQELRTTRSRMTAEVAPVAAEDIRGGTTGTAGPVILTRAAGQHARMEFSSIFRPRVLDDFALRMLCGSAWGSEVVKTEASVQINAVQTPPKAFRHGGTPNHFDPTVWLPGMWVLAAGFTGAGINSLFEVVGTATASFTDDLLLVRRAAGIVTETGSVGGPRTLTLMSSVNDGLTDGSFVIEEQPQELTNIFMTADGVRLSSLGMSGAVNTGHVETTIQGIGKRVIPSQVATVGGSTVTALAKVPYSLVDDMTACVLGDVDTLVRSFSLTLTRDRRVAAALAQPTPEQIGLGGLRATGQAELLFKSRAEVELALAFTESNVAFLFEDSLATVGRDIVSFPSVRLHGMEVTTPARDSDILARVSFTAQRHADSNATVIWARDG